MWQTTCPVDNMEDKGKTVDATRVLPSDFLLLVQWCLDLMELQVGKCKHKQEDREQSELF